MDLISKPRSYTLTESSAFNLTGFQLLTIDAVESDSKNVQRHAEMVILFKDPYPTTLLSYADVYRSLMAPSQIEAFHAPKRASNAMGTWDYIRKVNICEENEPLSKRKSKTVNRLLPEFEDIHQDLQNASLHIQSPRAGRAFFISTTGFMGLVPKDTVVGDFVYVFLGARMPLVVRRRDNDTFRLIGECLVSGLMHGEAMDGLSEDQLKNITLL
jgi:hypothetical protein